MTTDELMTEWIDKTARGRVKPRTLSRYRGLIDHHIHPVLGAREIGEVGRRQIADFLLDAARGTREGTPVLSASSVNLLRSVLHGAFAYACDMELLTHNPCERIRRAQEPRGGTVAFSKEEQRLLEGVILASEDRRLFGVYLCLYSGLRIGELIGLEWEDVDFTARVLRVTKTVYREQDESGVWRLYVDRPKTRSSERVIPLPGFLMARLRTYRRGPYVHAFLPVPLHAPDRGGRGAAPELPRPAPHLRDPGARMRHGRQNTLRTHGAYERKHHAQPLLPQPDGDQSPHDEQTGENFLLTR